MIINEDYFKDLEINDEDIIEDGINDVDEPKHKPSLEELHKLPEQYDYQIKISIFKNTDSDTTFFQTTLIPKLFKRLDAIFDMYGIEHSLYVITASTSLENCNTSFEFGKYQIFCGESEKYRCMDKTFDGFFDINVYLNYPQFSYKRVSLFLYTFLLNLFRIGKHINYIGFYPYANDYVTIYFWFHYIPNANEIRFRYYNKKTNEKGDVINLSKELTEENKRDFYNHVFRYFFGMDVKIDYKALERDVPFKPIKPFEF